MKDKPNVILINCDDLGWGDLGCYGHPRNKTPHLDRMAAEGVRFTDFYMASPVCSPSRGAMMTGCYPPRIGFGEFDGQWVLFPSDPIGLSPSEITVADVLKGQGYATKLVGKWHCGDQPEFLPTRHGFDEYYGLPYSNDMGRQSGARTEYPPLPLMRNEEVIEAQPDQRSITERYVEESVRFLRDHRDGPFFLYLAHMYVHLPHYPQERFLRESQNGVYGACVAAIDWAAGVLFAELARLGIDEETLVFFTSDNGSRNDFGDSNGALRGRKGTTWEGGQRVAGIVRWPGQVPAGQVMDQLATSMDLMPTFAGLAGAEVPKDRVIDGHDILSLMRCQAGAKTPYQEFFYFMRRDLEAVRAGDWKLHVRKSGEECLELYNLHADVGESQNQAAERPEVVADLQQRLEAGRADLGDHAVGVSGANCRPIGRIAEGRPLTEFDPNHPYYIAMYDLSDAG